MVDFDLTLELNTIVLAVGAGLAWLTINASNKRARAQRTLAFFESWVGATEDLAKAGSLLRGLEKAPSDEALEQLVKKNERWPCVILALNKFEGLAIGLKYNVYNKRMMEDCFNDRITSYFEISEPVVKYLRNLEKDDSIFQNFEELAKMKINP